VDERGCEMRSLCLFWRPDYLSLDEKGNILVADYDNHCVFQLSTDLQVHRASTNLQMQLWRPTRMCYNALASQLCVVHSDINEMWSPSNVVSVFSVEEQL